MCVSVCVSMSMSVCVCVCECVCEYEYECVCECVCVCVRPAFSGHSSNLDYQFIAGCPLNRPSFQFVAVAVALACSLWSVVAGSWLLLLTSCSSTPFALPRTV